MADLIDRQACRAKMVEYVFPITANNLMGAADAYHRMIHLLDAAPTIEAEPVRHGRWEQDGDCVICSECGEEHAWDEYRATYCEDCGAKMDGGIDHAKE